VFDRELDDVAAPPDVWRLPLASTWHSAIRVEPIESARLHAVLESRRIDAEIGTQVRYFAPTPRRFLPRVSHGSHRSGPDRVWLRGRNATAKYFAAALR